MITGIVRTEKITEDSREVYWVIDDLGQKLEEADFLQSEVFSFGGQQWRVLLQIVEMGFQVMNIALSRVTISKEEPLPACILWRAGILDKDGTWHYDRNGVARKDTVYKEWMTVDDWPGPEWSYILLKKDLYMPGDRFTVAVDFRWDPESTSKDSEGTKTNKIAGTLRTEEFARYFKEVFWTVSDFERRLEESDTLLSDVFFFENQNWRLSLQSVHSADTSYINISLERVTIYDKLPLFPSVWWHAGILDVHEGFHYCQSGWDKLGKKHEVWTKVAEWRGPDWTHLFKKDLFISQNRLTVSFGVCCFGLELPALTGSYGYLSSTPKSVCRHRPRNCDITLKVKDRAFHTHWSVLEHFSPVFVDKFFSYKDDVVKLDDCDPKVFETFLTFAYTGMLDEVAGEMIRQVYELAHKYVATDLVLECIQRLVSTLTVDTVCDVLSLADNHADDVLREGAAEFFVTKARDVFRTASWLQFMVTHTKLANDLIIRSHEMAN